LGYILSSSGRTSPSDPNTEIMILASVMIVTMLVATGLTFWWNYPIRRAERRLREQRTKTRGQSNRV
jgi:hypothetical protein